MFKFFLLERILNMLQHKSKVSVKKHYFLLLLLVLIECASINAQADSTEVDYIADIQFFNSEDGLSDDGIHCFARDQRGILWLGTFYGLNRFDGQNFKVFLKKDGLANNDIKLLYPDGAVFWCIYEDKSRRIAPNFFLFHTTEERAISLSEHLNAPLPFEKNEVSDIQIHQDVLLFEIQRNSNRIYYLYRPQSGFQQLSFNNKEELIFKITPTNNIWTLYQTENKFIFRQLDKNAKVVQNYTLDLNVPTEIYRIAFIKEDTDQSIWLGLGIPFRVGIPNIKIRMHLTRDGKIERTKKTTSPSPDAIGKFNLIDLEHYPSKNLFLTSPEFRFPYLVTFDGKILYDFSKVIKSPSEIRFIEQELLWMTGDNGLYRIRLQPKNFSVLSPNYPFRSITSIDSILYFSSNQIQSIKPLTNNIVLVPGISSVKDSEGQLLYSLGGLRRYNTKTKNDALIYSNPESVIWSLYVDKSNNIWFSDYGVNQFIRKTGEVRPVPYNQFEDLKNSIVYHFYEKENGNIWLCSTTGIYEMSPEKGIIGRYWKGGEGAYYLPSSDIRHLHFDKQEKAFWLAGMEEGLIYWNPTKREAELIALPTEQSNRIHAVYPDDFDNLWLSTENGIIQFHKTNRTTKIYLPKDGVSSNEFNRISHFTAADGSIYFGSINGVTTFHPNNLAQSQDTLANVNIIVVEHNKYVGAINKIENQTSKYHTNHQIKLASGDRFFNLTFTLNDYAYTTEVSYSYRLKGVENDWNEIPFNRFTFSGFPYGNQTLQIRALLQDGKFSETLEIPVKVLKPFYLTWWFFVLVLTLILSGILWYNRRRTKRFLEQKEVLEKEVALRTAQIEEDKKTIEQQAADLKELDKIKSRFFANVSHELRTPITLIQGPIQAVLKSNELNNRNFTLLSKAKQNAQNLLLLVNEILDLTKLEVNKLNLEEEKVVFYTFLKRIVSSFQSFADAKSIQFGFVYEPAPDLQIELDNNKFEKILNNLLSNAFKFTPKNGRIDVLVKDLGKDLLLYVKDNGRGIPQKDVPNVFNRFYQSSTNTTAEGGLGIGLALSMEFIKLMNAKMWVESSIDNENSGSTFYVQFPKKEIISMISDEDQLALKADAEPRVPQLIPNKETAKSPQNGNPAPKPTILLVEDNLDLKEYIQFLLEPYYEVVTAENGKEGLEWLCAPLTPREFGAGSKGEPPSATLESKLDSGEAGRSSPSGAGGAQNNRPPSTLHHPPSLIISDIMMPIMDGYEFLEKVKSEDAFRHIPTIMLTARAESKDKLRALRIGVDDYLLKPFDEEELLVRIENLLRNAKSRQVFSDEETAVPSDKPSISQKDMEWLEQTEQFIIQNIASSLFSVDYLAELLDINRRKLFRRLKALTGLTPNHYIRTIRLKIAKDLLENRDCKSVKEVAQKVGFSNQDYFSNLYQQEFGKIPSEFF